MRDRAAHECQIAHAGHANIRDELASSSQIAVVFQARHGLADAFARRLPHELPFSLARRAW
jgi:hypothetical protein